MTVGDGGKRWKLINIRTITLLTSVYTITHEVRANASRKYIHK
jgi:hypothetical protein